MDRVNKFNPFRPDKLVRPGMFAGRFEELQLIDQCLMQARHSNAQHFLIEGERGIGKSSLMLCAQLVAQGHVQTMGRDTVNFIVASVSLDARDDFHNLLKRLAAALKAEVQKNDPLKKIVVSAWDFLSRIEAGGVKLRREESSHQQSDLTTAFVDDLQKVILQAGESIDGIFLLIDEADKPSSSADLGSFCKSITEELTRRGIDKVCIGLAGLPATINKLRDSHESSPRLFKIMSLSPLSEKECIEVIDQAIHQANEVNAIKTVMQTEAKTTLAGLSEGYPHFLQEFGYWAFEEDTDNNLTEKDVLDSLFKENGAFDQLGRKYFDQYYYASSSRDYQKVLDVLSPNMDAWVERSAIITNSGLSGATVDNALRALKKRGIILQNEQGRGAYRLPTRSFAVWIRIRKIATNQVDIGDPATRGAP